MIRWISHLSTRRNVEGNSRKFPNEIALFSLFNIEKLPTATDLPIYSFKRLTSTEIFYFSSTTSNVKRVYLKVAHFMQNSLFSSRLAKSEDPIFLTCYIFISYMWNSIIFGQFSRNREKTRWWNEIYCQ